MLLVSVDELAEDDLLGKGLYAPDGRLMLKHGVRLNARLIEGIKRLGHSYVFVQMTDRRSQAGSADWKRNMRTIAEDVLMRFLEAVRTNKPLPVRPLYDWADYVSEALPEKAEISIRPDDLAKAREAIAARGVNVGILSAAIAKSLGYREAAIRDVAIGSLLHDIGLAVPLENKLALHHPAIGYDCLRKIPGFPQAALQIVLQHHERIDGRGFPQGLRGEDVREASQICALAGDIHEFLNESLTDRLPHEGIEYAMSKIDTSYHYGVVRAFLDIYEPYPVGTRVTLTGHLQGTVIENNRAHAARPVIRLQASGDRFDLMQHPAFLIERVCGGA